MSMSREAGGFHTTHWSVVGSAAGGCQKALEELCIAYWQPLYWYVRRLGYHQADAEDLTQAFFARLLETGLVAEADQRRGRFRTFLLTALRRFLINEWKRAQTAKRGGGRRPLPFDVAGAEARMIFEPSHNVTPDALFERCWAVQVLQHATARLQQMQEQAGKADWFAALLPSLSAREDGTSYAVLAERLDSTPAALKMAVCRLRKDLARLVREEIRKTVTSETEVEEERMRLIAALRA
jgi:RNA polymerase sigma factor (sigma-70 family)